MESLNEGEGSGSHDQSVAIVVETTPPRSQSRIRDDFRNYIMNEGGESGEASGEATRPAHKIQRVPQTLRQKEEAHKYYDPQLVSIGPYYCSDANLKLFEKFKIKFTGDYVRRYGPPHSMDELYDKVADVAGKARSCYAKGTTEGIDDTTFTEMLFVDGCFILQFISCIVNDEEDQLKNWTSKQIALVQRDLFLLENQLPFKVLLALKTSRFGDDLIDKFIENILRGTHLPKTSRVYDQQRMLPLHSHATPDEQGVLPLHSHATPDEQGETPDEQCDLLEYAWAKNLYCGRHKSFSHCPFPRRSAMDLKMVGIQLRPYDTDLLSYIAFKSTWNGGIMTLSKINIDNTTISLLMNMVAYEHCPNSCAPNLCATNYICFLDSIIDSAKDVEELKYAGIILNFWGNDAEVVKVIHGMAAGLVPDYRYTCYLEVKLRIEEYHSHKGKTKIATWISEVMRDHFRSPWTAIAVLAALLALFLTAVNTYFTAFRHAKNPSATT